MGAVAHEVSPSPSGGVRVKADAGVDRFGVDAIREDTPEIGGLGSPHGSLVHDVGSGHS